MKCRYCGLESEAASHDSYITCAGKLRDRVKELEAQVNALSGLNPEGIRELVEAADRTVSVWQYEPCHAKALALERVMGDLQDALAKVKKED